MPIRLKSEQEILHLTELQSTLGRSAKMFKLLDELFSDINNNEVKPSKSHPSFLCCSC